MEGRTLTVADTGYNYTGTTFDCTVLANGEIKIRLVDFSPICDPANPNAADPTVEHDELQIILAIDQHPNLHDPFSVKSIDCVNGPGSPAIARYLHYPVNAPTMPDKTIQADSGTVMVTQYDSRGVNPVQGTFDLTFGPSHVTGDFNTLLCP